MLAGFEQERRISPRSGKSPEAEAPRHLDPPQARRGAVEPGRGRGGAGHLRAPVGAGAQRGAVPTGNAAALGRPTCGGGKAQMRPLLVGFAVWAVMSGS